MAIINRAGLKVKFKNGCLPTEMDFCDLIESSLNKRDDQFFGNWQSGFTYYHGDVVIYDKTFYMYQSPDAIQPCDEEPVEKPNTGYCSTTPPGEDNGKWCKLQVDNSDGDWDFVRASDTNGLTKSVMYDNGFDYVGIGTKNPESQFHVASEGAGEFRFSCDELNPTTSLVNSRPDMCNYLLTGVNNDQVVLSTDSNLGFVFLKGNTYSNPKEIEKEVNLKEAKLLHIHPSGQVGIGKSPEEFELDVKGRVRNNGNFQIADPEKMTPIEKIGPVLDKVCKTIPTKYQWKNLKIEDKQPLNFYGIQTKECDDFFPDALFTDSKGHKSISYDGLVPILFKAIQELNTEIQGLKKQLNSPSMPK